MKNKNLNDAKFNKDDEYYTMYKDVENELKHYHDQLKGKKIYCNCDTKHSQFVQYLLNNEDTIGYHKLIYTSNDFRTNTKYLEWADIVITNPPFSLFKEYVDQLMENDKKFLIIGSIGAAIYKNIFSYITNNKMWLGMNNGKKIYNRPDGTIKIMNNTVWYTNLFVKNRNKNIYLYKEYNETDYPKYVNYDAINVGYVKNIPKDYYGEMGVPITYLSKHNPDQFEIIGSSITVDLIPNDNITYKGKPKNLWDSQFLYTNNITDYYDTKNKKNIKRIFGRLIIKRKENQNEE